MSTVKHAMHCIFFSSYRCDHVHVQNCKNVYRYRMSDFLIERRTYEEDCAQSMTGLIDSPLLSLHLRGSKNHFLRRNKMVKLDIHNSVFVSTVKNAI